MHVRLLLLDIYVQTLNIWETNVHVYSGLRWMNLPVLEYSADEDSCVRIFETPFSWT